MPRGSHREMTIYDDSVEVMQVILKFTKMPRKTTVNNNYGVVTIT